MHTSSLARQTLQRPFEPRESFQPRQPSQPRLAQSPAPFLVVVAPARDATAFRQL